MPHLTIENIGPIKRADFDLNKINVFMGPQSSGKSTIVKIVSYCLWYEKSSLLHSAVRANGFFDELIKFHNIESTYFNAGSRIVYTSETARIDARWGDRENSVERFTVGNGVIFKNRKISYIPAERNFVTMPGIGRYSERRDIALNFLYDWFAAKNETAEGNAFKVPVNSLDAAEFFYDKSDDLDRVKLRDGLSIKLSNSSSGLRSTIPLLLVFDYLTRSIFNSSRTLTPIEVVADDANQERAALIKLKREIDAVNASLRISSSLGEESDAADDTRRRLRDISRQLTERLGVYSEYDHSEIIIEEPELNLFPRTQRDLVYHMLGVVNDSGRDHRLILTTHSPFILFAINNCMMGGLVGHLIPPDESRSMPSREAWINPREVSIFEIHDGEVSPIQDSDGIIEDNYLNQAYKDNTAEYLAMLDYYDE